MRGLGICSVIPTRDAGGVAQAVSQELGLSEFFTTRFMMTPAVAAVFMSLSTVIVAVNAQVLRGFRRAR